MKKIILSTAMIMGLTTGAAMADIPTASPDGHEAVKAEVVDSTPASYTINVKSLSNLGVDQDAETFAVYVSSSKPDTCGDFVNTPLSYSKPEKYLRQFDLTQNEDILSAIDQYNCVIIPNKPM